MSNSQSQLRKFSRLLGLGALLFACAFLGVYAGFVVFVDTGSDEGVAIAAQSEPASYLHFEAGDALPNEPVLRPDSSAVELHQVVSDSNTLLIFVTFHCDPCVDLLRTWNSSLQDRVRQNVKTVICLRSDEWAVPVEYQGLLTGYDVVYYNPNVWEQRFNMVFWPCIIGVDNSGFVEHVQFGWENAIDYELATYFFNPNQ